MTKAQAISALIINRIAQGQSPQEAFDAVIGAGAYERLAGEIWDAFQSDAKSCIIADTLRSTLRNLAEADARLYRGLAEELATPATRPALPHGDIAAAIALLERHGYRVTPPEG